MTGKSQPLALVAAAALALMAGAGCGSGPDKPRASGNVAHVTLRDFAISGPARVAAGEVTLSVHNTGPDTHELLVARARSRDLPLRRDGLTVDEDAIESKSLGEVEDSRPGATHPLRVRLVPGHYVLFCNMSGHYKGGMHRDLVVS